MILHLGHLQLVYFLQVLRGPCLLLPVDLSQFGVQELIPLATEGQFLLTTYFKLQVFLVELLILAVGLLDLLQTALYLLVHDLLDVLDLLLLLDQVALKTLLPGGDLDHLLLLPAQLEVQLLDILDESYPVLLCLLLQAVVLIDTVLVLSFQQLVLADEDIHLVLALLLI